MARARTTLRTLAQSDLNSGERRRRALTFGGRQSSSRSVPISLFCLANTRRPHRKSALSSCRRESLLVSSCAAERCDVSTDSPERPRSFPLSSRGTGDRKTDERPLNWWKELTNARLSAARSHPLHGRPPTSSCWTARRTHLPPHAG